MHTTPTEVEVNDDNSLDSVEVEHLKHSTSRREDFVSGWLPKLLFAIYLISAGSVTFLCLTSSSIRSYLTVARSAEAAHQETRLWSSLQFAPLAASASNEESSDAFAAQYSCPSGDQVCSDNYNNFWCCSNSDVCDSNYNYCDSIPVGLVVGIFIAVWVGPLVLYLCIIFFIRWSNADRFRRLADSGQYQSWVIVRGCFQMSIERSSGDADFNQVVFRLVNVFGGCGDECALHTVGICCFGACYPCCMCCVSAGRNQTKVGTLQSSLAGYGYNTNVQFLSSVIPACCNSIFIGKLGHIQSNVMVITGSGGLAVASAPLYQQQQYGQPQYSVYQQPYTQAVIPPSSQPAPSYQAQAPSYGAVSQPPEVTKP